MEFKFKRKYTKFFMVAIILHLFIVAFLVFVPESAIKFKDGKKTIAILSLINCELILIFYLGLFRKKYFAYHDKILIKRSLLPSLTIDYKNILSIKEKKSDSILFGFGIRPSFTIYYTSKNSKRKKHVIRADNTQLLLTTIKNEINIFDTKTKKLTK